MESVEYPMSRVVIMNRRETTEFSLQNRDICSQQSTSSDPRIRCSFKISSFEC